MGQKITLTAGASDDITSASWAKINTGTGREAATGHAELSPQVMRVMATCSASNGSGTLSVAYVDAKNSYVYKIVTATCVAGSRRTNLSNAASGDYVCTVTFADTSSDKHDILGANASIITNGSTTGPSGGPIDIYIGWTATTNSFTTLNLNAELTRCV